MADLESRLTSCVLAVFPSLPPDDVPRASSTTLETWDSTATVTLMALVEEEFGLEIAPDDLTHFISFQQVLAYLRNKTIMR
jgi:acyl carrier protein